MAIRIFDLLFACGYKSLQVLPLTPVCWFRHIVISYVICYLTCPESQFKERMVSRSCFPQVVHRLYRFFVACRGEGRECLLLGVMT
jgi:hypothetical protein